jgi:dynein light intermediate chain
MEGPPRETLVQFEPPQEVTGEFSSSRKKPLGPAGRKKTSLPPMESKPSTEDILNAILPPREWADGTKRFIQYVSKELASRTDVTNLKNALDQKLMERQARDSGICPVREELYSQCFDELIRQITIDCPERGLLLMRIRDEIRMTIAAYQTLYQSSVTFGTRKQLQSEEGKAELEQRVSELEKQKTKLENRKSELVNKKEALLKMFEEKRAADEAKRKAEIDFLDYQGKHLQEFLKNLDKA